VLFGDGLEKGPTTYADYSWNRNLFERLRRLPKNVMVAGDFISTSSAPLFGHVLVYVNRNLAHPFRLGFWAEAERRILETYRALYATSLDEIVDFAEREKIDYLLWQTGTLKQPDKRLFRPVKQPLDAMFKKNKAIGFALAKELPKEAIAFRDHDTVLLDLKKLAALKASGRLMPPSMPPSDGVSETPASPSTPTDSSGFSQ
jgi:hypothetical protein